MYQYTVSTILDRKSSVKPVHLYLTRFGKKLLVTSFDYAKLLGV